MVLTSRIRVVLGSNPAEASPVPRRSERFGRSAHDVADEVLEPFDRLRHVSSSEANSKVVAGVLELRAGQKKHAFRLHKPGAEAVDGARGVRAEAREADAACARPNPGETGLVTAEEVIEEREVAPDDL